MDQRNFTETIKVTPDMLRNHTKKAFLTVIRGLRADIGKSLLVEKPVTLGREQSCDFPLFDPGISRRHARIVPQQGQYVLEDLGSKNGTKIDGRALSAPLPLADGQKLFLASTVVRFTLADPLEVDFHREMVQLVSTDPLTGLESKYAFDNRLDQELAIAGDQSTPLAVLMMDLDGIKTINDTHGHLFGSFCIQRAGQIIGRVVGDLGHACRFGGDEFTVFLVNHDRNEAMAVGERIRREIDTAGLVKDGIVLHPTISIGVAAYPEKGPGVLDLITAADLALYRAKAKGKNLVCD